MVPELNEVLSQSVKIINYTVSKSALNTPTRLRNALCDEMGSDSQIFFSIRNFVGCPAVRVLKRLYELRKEVELFLIDKKSELSHYF